MGSDNHLIRAMEAIDSFKPDHLILDAISACVRMGSEQAAFDYLMRLVSVVKERGITCILTNQISGLVGSDEELSGIGFSSVVDAVVQLRFVETGQEISRQMLVVKSRGSAHSNRRQSFVITDRGIEFPDNPQPPPVRAGKAAPEGRWKMSQSPQAKPRREERTARPLLAPAVHGRQRAEFQTGPGQPSPPLPGAPEGSLHD